MDSSRLEIAAYLVLAFVPIRALCWLTRVPPDARRKLLGLPWRHRKLLFEIAFFAAVVFALPVAANTFLNVTSDPHPDPHWKFWLQTFTGNWAGDVYPGKTKDYWWALSALFALLLNNALYVGIITLIWRLVSERNRVMNFAHAVKNRDAIVKAFIRTAIGHTGGLSESQKTEIANAARDAFNQGVQKWEAEYLEAAVGPEEANRIRAIFREGQEGSARTGAAAGAAAAGKARAAPAFE